MIARPDQPNAHTLALEFGPGRADFASQLLMRPPGTYRLTGKYKGTIEGRRGLLWRVTCAGGGNDVPLGESSMFVGETSAWAEWALTFTVPEAGCRAQELRLSLAARCASERNRFDPLG